MIQKKLGLLIIFFSLVITFNLFIMSKSDVSFFIKNPLISSSQILALFGTVFLCYSFVLSSKFSFLENWFGGFDNVYKYHRLSGGLSYVMLLTHPLFLIANSLPNKKAALLYILPSNVWGYNFGIFALWTMIVLIFLTIYVKLPYHIWKKPHEYMGLVLLFGALHIFLVSSDISRFIPLKVWMLFLLTIAGISYTYVKFLYFRLGPKFSYVLENIERKNDIIEILLRPVTKNLKFSPGQFAFLKFEDQGINPEMHPFSISSDPYGYFLRFSIKILGDFTLSLRALQKGSIVKVFGPYGKFSDEFYKPRSAVCIAGGIGVTPFLGMLSHEARRTENVRDVFMFYCGRDPEELYYHNEISSLAQACPSIKYTPYISSEKGRLRVEQIIQTVGNLKDKLIFLCGPLIMMKDLKKQFVAVGVNSNNIYFEEFNFK